LLIRPASEKQHYKGFNKPREVGVHRLVSRLHSGWDTIFAAHWLLRGALQSLLTRLFLATFFTFLPPLAAMGRMDVAGLRYLSKDELRVLQAVEQGMKNHDLVPVELISSIASLKHGGAFKCLSTLLRGKLLRHDRKKYDGALCPLSPEGLFRCTGTRDRTCWPKDFPRCTVP
jgi:hypothetical protein